MASLFKLINFGSLHHRIVGLNIHNHHLGVSVTVPCRHKSSKTPDPALLQKQQQSYTRNEPSEKRDILEDFTGKPNIVQHQHAAKDPSASGKNPTKLKKTQQRTQDATTQDQANKIGTHLLKVGESGVWQVRRKDTKSYTKMLQELLPEPYNTNPDIRSALNNLNIHDILRKNKKKPASLEKTTGNDPSSPNKKRRRSKKSSTSVTDAQELAKKKKNPLEFGMSHHDLLGMINDLIKENRKSSSKTRHAVPSSSSKVTTNSRSDPSQKPAQLIDNSPKEKTQSTTTHATDSSNKAIIFQEKSSKLKSREKIPPSVLNNIIDGKTATLKTSKKKKATSVQALELELLKTESKSKNTSSKASVTQKRREDLHQQMLGYRKLVREKKFHEELESFIAVCVSGGMVNRAFATLEHYSMYKNPAPPSLRAFNIGMQGMLNDWKVFRVMSLKKLLLKLKIKPDATTQALHIAAVNRVGVRSAEVRSDIEAGLHTPSSRDDSIARMEYYLSSAPSRAGSDVVAQRYITGVLNQMLQEDMSVDALFAETHLMAAIDQDALAGVRRVRPDYDPPPPPLHNTPGYECPLVNHLNTSKDYGVSNMSRGGGSGTEESPPSSSGSPYVVSSETIEEQFAIELQGQVPIQSVHLSNENKHLSDKLEIWKQRWRDALTASLDYKMKELASQFFSDNTKRTMDIYPYLALFDIKLLVNILLQELTSLATGSENYCHTSAQLHHRLGSILHGLYVTRYKTDSQVLDRLKLVYADYAELFGRHAEHGLNGRVLLGQLCHAHPEGPRLDHGPPNWPYQISKDIGRFFYDIMKREIRVWTPIDTEEMSSLALLELDRNAGYNNMLEIRPHDALFEIFDQKGTLMFPPTELPMLCPPLPWTNCNTGGYLLQPVQMVRLPPNTGRAVRRNLQQCPNRQLFPVLDSINCLANMPWRINGPMLDVLTEVFTKNGAPELDVPQHPTLCPKPKPVSATATKEQLKKFKNQQQLYNKRINEMHSLWCSSLYKLSIANHYRDRVFWFPHNVDFRGRAYTVPPHLSHLNSDVFRSVLQFAVAKPLGRDGLNWLKTHIINLTGLKKHSRMKDRLAYCSEVLPEILDSARQPLTGRRWWTQGDEPWQTLAACKELEKALSCPNPEEYQSRLPIHQDGSCNGLQHYAALGRDTDGANSVNLAPHDTPQDVYTEVAELVEQQRARDASDSRHRDHYAAQLLAGHIKRKVIKPTVMTTVYGVTKFGAFLQMSKKLKEETNLRGSERMLAARYLTSATFASLAAMFSATKDIQDWLTNSAGVITKKCGRSVEWVTPLGLPILQPYFQPITKSNILKLSHDIPIKHFSDLMVPITLKQRNAFPPNFIHSLDATHLMLTALHCQGISFASVHDCYWTHASTVDIMSKACRQQFVALHSEPLLQQLSDGLYQRYGYAHSEFKHDGSCNDSSKLKVNNVLRDVPKLGNFDIELVKNSTFFFS